MKAKKLIEIGWEEWIALPELNLPAIRAKVDTGAKTSALHAFMVEKFFEDDITKIKFGIHPVPERPEIEVYSTAQLIDERVVISSNGQSELRYVIRTMAQFGGEKWPIEITLTNRETMNYRMLIGRSAMEGRVLVVPEQSFLLGTLSAELYEHIQTQKHERTLRICLLSKNPNDYTTSRIASSAEARGHEVDIINPEHCYASLRVDNPNIHYHGRVLDQYDAVIPWIHRDITAYGLAILRQFELLGTFSLNSSEGMTKSGDRLLAYQLLSKSQVMMPTTAFCQSPSSSEDLINIINGAPLTLRSLNSTNEFSDVIVNTDEAAHAAIQVLKSLKSQFVLQKYSHDLQARRLRCVILGNKIIATIDLNQPALSKNTVKKNLKPSSIERKTALRAARILGLKFASVDFIRENDNSYLIAIRPNPSLKKIEKSSKKDIASILIEYLEYHARPISFPVL